ncbi:hypothetical protein N7G274_009767 [Stereocaulon virgatum]|uniref:Heme oxygenase-like protein n=1 Tax=Stereocaulon virgatum TaxID=373712 RepID=A0ABR3ZXN9_9LECA
MLDSQTPSASIAPALSQRINIATRVSHAHLNALILSLLPLGLPPYATEASFYARGLRGILPIYEAFEGAFRLVLSRSRDEHGGKEMLLSDALGHLHMPELERAGRLRNDIERILGASLDLQEERAQASRLHTFTTHIRASVGLRPHLLLTYTWLLYMALFNGGRYIHAKLRQAGPAFWKNTLSKEEDGFDTCLCFWGFDGQGGGEDIKAEFKRRFAGVELCLTDGEKEDVVQEAVLVMQTLVEVVNDISHHVGMGRDAKQAGLANGQNTQMWEKSATQRAEEDELSMSWLLLRHVLPIGMAELIEGARRAVITGT